MLGHATMLNDWFLVLGYLGEDGGGACGAVEVVVEPDAGDEREELAGMWARRPSIVRLVWRSRSRWSSSVQEIDSMHWQIGAKYGPGPDSSLQLRRSISAPWCSRA